MDKVSDIAKARRRKRIFQPLVIKHPGFQKLDNEALDMAAHALRLLEAQHIITTARRTALGSGIVGMSVAAYAHSLQGFAVAGLVTLAGVALRQAYGVGSAFATTALTMANFIHQEINKEPLDLLALAQWQRDQRPISFARKWRQKQFEGRMAKLVKFQRWIMEQGPIPPDGQKTTAVLPFAPQ